MEQYYRISESKLRELLEDSLTLSMLTQDGVDNWEHYGVSRFEIIRDFFPDAEGDELDNLTFTDCADVLIRDGFEVGK